MAGHPPDHLSRLAPGWFLLAEGAGRGRLLFMPGRGDIYEKYLESLDDWQRCGWHVTALDWRGREDRGGWGWTIRLAISVILPSG
jgi:hypothetical protein